MASLLVRDDFPQFLIINEHLMKRLHILLLLIFPAFEVYSQEEEHHGIHIEGRVFEQIDKKKDYLIGA